MAFCVPFPWRITLHRTTIIPSLSISSQLPFTASALGGLPPRVLLQIISYFGTSPRDRCLITSICSDLRTLALAQSSLWTDIDLRYSKGVWWAKVCLKRSGSAPLRVHMQWPNEHYSLSHVVDLVHDTMLRMDTLYFEAGHDFDPSVVPEFSTKTAPLLRSVVGYGPRYGWHPYMPELNTWAPLLLGTGAQLTNLVLHGGDIRAFPLLPELKHLELTYSRVSIANLYTLLDTQSQLEILILSDIVPSEGLDNGIAALQDVSSLRHPSMHTLRLTGYHELVRAILSVMDYPKTTFEVYVRRYSSTNGYFSKLPGLCEAQPLITRMMKFWKDRTGAQSLPRGRLIVHPGSASTELYNTIIFGTPRPTSKTPLLSEPSTFFSFEGQLDKPIPYADMIDTMQIRFSSPAPFDSIIYDPALPHANDLILPEVQWRLLATVDRLIVTGAGRLSRVDERANVRQFMKREGEKRTKSRPLSVEFNFCDPSLRTLAEEFVKEGVWSEMRWNHV